MKKTLIIKNAASIIMLIVFVGILIAAIFKGLEPKVPEIKAWEPYYVKQGDTYWDILKTDEYDTRVIIDIVKEHNHSGDVLPAFTWIEVPIY